MLTVLQQILAQFEPGKSLKDAYMAEIENESPEDMMSNRIKLRKYLQELNHFHNQAAQANPVLNRETSF